MDGEASGMTFWWIYMRLAGGGYLRLSFDTEDYSSCDAALGRICEATEVRRSDFDF